MATSYKPDWEATFNAWSQPLGQVEIDKSENAIRAVKKALEASAALANRSTSVFVQGSYRNRTGVRQESDVDVCIQCHDMFYHNDIPLPDTEAGLGFLSSSYSFDAFRNDVHLALNAHFGEANVTPGNKAFEVHENTYRVDADVVACINYRHYFRDQFGALKFAEGTALYSRDGVRVTNFPNQQYDNGVWKNQQVLERFKPMVRIFKKLSCDMVENGVQAAGPMKSFLLESLVWNAPDEAFYGASLRDRVDAVLSHLWTLLNERTDGEWWEENDIKPLFAGGQKWTSAQVRDFIQAAWDYTRD